MARLNKFRDCVLALVVAVLGGCASHATSNANWLANAAVVYSEFVSREWTVRVAWDIEQYHTVVLPAENIVASARELPQHVKHAIQQTLRRTVLRTCTPLEWREYRDLRSLPQTAYLPLGTVVGYVATVVCTTQENATVRGAVRVIFSSGV